MFKAQCILGDYVRNRYPRQPTRFGRLLLAIPLLRMIRSSTVETFFFRDTVGETSVLRLLHDMYNADRINTSAAVTMAAAAAAAAVANANNIATIKA